MFSGSSVLANRIDCLHVAAWCVCACSSFGTFAFFQAIYPGTKDAVHEFVLGSLCGCSVQSDGCVK